MCQAINITRGGFDMQDNIIGNRILELRKKANEKQEDLAKILRCNRASIAKYENGDRIPDGLIIAKIARHYNTTSDYILGLTDVKTTDKDLQFVCEYTGLSEYSVIVLGELLRSKDTENSYNVSFNMPLEQLNIINYFLNSSKFFDVVFELMMYKHNIETISQDYEKEISQNDDYSNLLKRKKSIDFQYQMCKLHLFDVDRNFKKLIDEYMADKDKKFETLKATFDSKIYSLKPEDGESNGNDN